MSQLYQDPFVTVVSVGIEEKTHQCTPKKALNNSEYITVLTIGNEEAKTIKDVTEEVIVYRLPGERLGFGLKFEGGTKAHEFVKRLFIQSCAPDSPASRVQSSWGQLVEGDEVLEIDSIAVNNMTRIDCVRFLKDSNVAIKLLVKHCFNTVSLKQKSKSSEDLPVIISTEEKKPPPVPPRKLNRKLHKTLQTSSDNVHDNIIPSIKQESFSTKSARLQSPRNSFRKKYSPDVARRLSDGSLAPPEAEIYLDLISQESTQSWSESDDTGSTISTVLDRFASFPTTATSSFAGSLPSTPTSIQKHLDLSYNINEFPDDDFLPALSKKGSRIEENNNIIEGSDEAREFKVFQPIDTFQEELDINPIVEAAKRPVIIPRSKDKINKASSNESTSTLPRLVDFVPKSPQRELDSSMETITRFLDNERFDFEFAEQDNNPENDPDYNMDGYSSKWILSSHLSTIGEDEEEQSGQECSSNMGVLPGPPRVMIESSEFGNLDAKSPRKENSFVAVKPPEDKQIPMEIPPSDSRQPPDGHEFPDFVETSGKTAIFDNYSPKPKEYTASFRSTWSQPVIKPLDRSISSSNYDLRDKMIDSDEEKYEPVEKSNLLHTRSQSLIDMSVFSKEKSSSKWNTLMEQRKSRLSKLKGLVIPEAAENDITPLLNIPEIKSITTSQIDLSLKVENNVNEIYKPIPPPAISPVVLPSWSSNSSLPKYSPAFKRKSFQVYPVSNVKKSDSSDAESSYDEYYHKYNESTSSRITDDPKSLESISSPTRSDYSFDYTSLKTMSIRDSHIHNSKDFPDSDNDSAVSSSQSSYNSRSSPPLSPTSEDKLNGQNRLLKPSSVEAINRKNILASAKCRSGKDIKIGSPVIQRKGSLEEDANVKQKLEIESSILSEAPLPNTALEGTNSIEEVVLKQQNIAIKPVVVNEPVVVEVGIERLVSVPPKIPEKNVDKPIPTKRTHIPQTPKETKTAKELAETRYENLVQKHSAYSILEKRNKPVNIQSLKANFENSSCQSLPVFPKNYKSDGKASPARTPPELANGETIIATRRRSEDFLTTARRRSDDKLLFRQISQEKVEKLETRRLSSGNVINSSPITPSLIPKEEPVKAIRATVKKQEIDRNIPPVDKAPPSTPNVEQRTIELNLDQPGGSLGITLAGGADYESKNITIHRIRYGSIAYQNGQLKKGDKVIAINNQPTAGLTHSAATELLKMPISKFSIVIEESKDFVPSTNLSRRISSSVSSLTSETKGHETNSLAPVQNKNPTHTIKVVKDGSGLGFSIEGGKDSPKGDVPLVVKKIFAGGAADKSEALKVGDEILSVNKIDFRNLSRIDAWSQMKKIPDGEVSIEIYR
ncbi:uncharacterized protein LOC109532877 isoform X2 [Dendroctonus ponderosae]|nr:uncharacterized protein LOC109532877 isoform X2 [Dendroctonus ponderosae]